MVKKQTEALPEFYKIADSKYQIVDFDVRLEHGGLRGVQLKGGVVLEGSESLEPTHYIKLDKVATKASGDFIDHPNFLYSSVNEALASIALKHIKNMATPSASYEYAEFHSFANREVLSGTISENFIPEGYKEHVLTSPSEKPGMVDRMISHKAFADEFVDVNPGSREMLITGMTDDSRRARIQKELFHMSTFDLLVENADRAHNPANIAFLSSNSGEIEHLLNFDYGRCFQYKNNPHIEHREDAIFKKGYIEKRMRELDIEPLEFDLEGFIEEVRDFREKHNAGVNGYTTDYMQHGNYTVKDYVHDITGHVITTVRENVKKLDGIIQNVSGSQIDFDRKTVNELDLQLKSKIVNEPSLQDDYEMEL